jgi:hypothetical protein
MEIPHSEVDGLLVLPSANDARIAKRISGNPGAQHNARCRSVRTMLPISAIFEMSLGALPKANSRFDCTPCDQLACTDRCPRTEYHRREGRTAVIHRQREGIEPDRDSGRSERLEIEHLAAS